MKWYEKLYVGESIKGKEKKIKWKINHNAGLFSVYVISLASNPNNLLDIIHTTDLMQKGYPKKDIRIIGIAKGKEEAMELVKRIIQETYDYLGTTNVEKYLKSKLEVQE